MTQTLYFYDLETSGVSARTARIMQFAGQRTGLDLKPIGEPDNYLIRLTNDVLPDPDAVLITGITPQATQADGLSETDFLRYFAEHIAVPGTVFAGFNTIRFDDEFMRFLMYRNFYDAYDWEWRDKRGRWDILDLVRMTRALRPEGINWPVTEDGKPTNRLELLTAANKLKHVGAHDALSDVRATIDVARLIRNLQPKLFDYLLKMRNKNEVAKLVNAGQPFVYTSGKYANAYEKTTVVATVGVHPSGQGVFVYDLRHDPAKYADKTTAELVKAMQSRPKDELQRFPVKSIKYNRCPAIAPLSVLDEASIKRLKLNLDKIAKHEAALAKLPAFYDRLVEAIGILDEKREAALKTVSKEVDALLYDGFFEPADQSKMSMVRAAETDEIASLNPKFRDKRLRELLPLYKARNYPGQLSQEERQAWDEYRYQHLMAGGEKSLVSRYFKRLKELMDQPDLAPEKQSLLVELQRYGESILPTSE